MISRPLTDALAGLRTEFPTTRTLVGDLSADAVFAIAADDLEDVLARLLELISLGQLGDRSAYEVFDLMVGADWLEWDMPAVQSIAQWADAWWCTALMSPPAAIDAGAVLGSLTHLELPMVRWLSVWLEELDGPGAQHLANLLTGESNGVAWDGRDDELDQVLAWARSEKVVNGFTMIGGSHLPDGQFARVLDRIVVIPGLD